MPVGVAAYKPANSHSENEPRVFDFIGMFGIPLVPCHEFPSDAKAGFFSLHALKDPELVARLSSFIAAGKPTLVTDGLAKRLGDQLDLSRPNVQTVPVQGAPKSLLEIPQEQLDKMRQPLLQPFARQFRAPNRVALYLFDDGSWVIENFNDQKVSVDLHGQTCEIEARGWKYSWELTL